MLFKQRGFISVPRMRKETKFLSEAKGFISEGKNPERREGFTLVELLVVITIIGILAAIGIVTFTGVQARARDGKRKADLQIIKTALEMYYADNGYYPPSSCGYDCNGYYYSTGGAEWIPGLAQYTEGRLPVDPTNSGGSPWGGGKIYAYGNVGKNTYPGAYDLTASLENKSDPDRCAVKCWRFYFNNQQWCTACGGSYDNQIYEAGPGR